MNTIMNMKKSTTLDGMLLRPLAVGERAFIRHNGHTLCTSTVVAITSVGLDSICFETQNTNYTLRSPAPAQAVSVPMPAYAAA